MPQLAVGARGCWERGSDCLKRISQVILRNAKLHWRHISQGARARVLGAHVTRGCSAKLCRGRLLRVGRSAREVAVSACEVAASKIQVKASC